MKLKSIKDLKNLRGKTVLFRVAYDVPLKEVDGHWQVADERRIKETLPTLKYLLKNKCRIVILSWLSRPGGKVVQKYKMDPVAKTLQKLIKKPVKKLDDCVGPKVFEKISKMKPGQIIMLENVRFYHQEEENNRLFSKLLVHGIDLICFDAFAQAHRVHSSTVGISHLRPIYAGLLLLKEIKFLTALASQPQKPLVVVLGGAKMSDKVAVLKQLVHVADKVLLGGGAANVFLKAKGYQVGRSMVESSFVDKAKRKKINILKVAKELLEKYPDKIILPVDLVSANKIDEKALVEMIDLQDKQVINKNYLFLDVGPGTIANYLYELKNAKTIFWNGPMGVFEIKKFAFGTKKIAEAVARSKATTVIGGGDTEIVVAKYGLDDKFTHISTGGGASLELIGGKELPALKMIIK
jgi:phosphoglycerate kinase